MKIQKETLMSKVESLHKAIEREGSGTWVNAQRYGNEPPQDREVRYILKKTCNDLWRLAIRGYNEGEELNAVVTGDNSVYAHVGTKYYGALDDYYPPALFQVDDEELDRYAELVKQPREGNDLLVEVLEEERLGSWEIWTPGPPDDYYPCDRFDYTRPDGGKVAYRTFDEKNEKWYYTKPTPVNIWRNGPEYNFNPRKRRPISSLAVSSLVERTTRTPAYVKPFTPQDSIL